MPRAPRATKARPRQRIKPLGRRHAGGPFLLPGPEAPWDGAKWKRPAGLAGRAVCVWSLTAAPAMGGGGREDQRIRITPIMNEPKMIRYQAKGVKPCRPTKPMKPLTTTSADAKAATKPMAIRPAPSKDRLPQFL